MQRIILLRFLCAFFVLSVVKHSAQTRAIDSLKTILKTAKQDTNRVNALSELAGVIAVNDPDTSIILGNQALTLAQKLNYKKGEAWAEFWVGRTYFFVRNFKDAMLHYNKSLAFSEALLKSNNQADIRSAKKLKGGILGNIANVYAGQAE